MSEQGYKVGYLLRSSITGFVVGTKVTEAEAPTFGALVKAPFGEAWIYGLIHEMHIDDDGTVLQIATTDAIAEAVIADNRKNRTVPLEISVLAAGHRKGKSPISHLLPPRPPLSLDVVWQCTQEEIVEFTERFGYLRHLLRNPDLPIAELIASHVQQAGAANHKAGRADWRQRASQELITLLRDDYEMLMQVLSALGDAFLISDF